jgi:ribose/xylose/arabinose/galactoside ABC-type transport system permease subunit
VSFLSSGGATLAMAAMGQTLVILSGGFDLSAGAVISRVNVTIAQNMQDTPCPASPATESSAAPSSPSSIWASWGVPEPRFGA